VGSIGQMVVDQVTVWNRALTSSQIKSHYKAKGKINNRAGVSYQRHFDAGPRYVPPFWNDAQVSIRFRQGDKLWDTSEKHSGRWTLGESKTLTLNCDFDATTVSPDKVSLKVTNSENQLNSAEFEPEYNAFVQRIDRLKRSWRSGYARNDNYDEFDITVDSKGNGLKVPFMLYLTRPSQITGLSPILCDTKGVPTGIPVQLSKNWHYGPLKTYLRAYMMLPVSKGKTTFKLRIPYGFYGSLPSASHSQLSLIGYSGNQRWDQLAIGCWGETYCMDVDMSCVDVVVTDIRGLMLRQGINGKKWSWTDAGWGGDWLGLKDAKGQKHLLNGIKTAYLAHGPCLTEVKYDGFYGAQREVDFKAKVRTLRTDDYARTFTTMDYSFDKQVKADGWLFKMGRTQNYKTPKIAYGNGAGLIKEHVIRGNIKAGTDFVKPVTLEGDGPWWVTFPGAHHVNPTGMGPGYRAMVIRSYNAKIGGKEYTRPTVAFPVFQALGGGEANLDFVLTAPEGTSVFSNGDTVSFEVEWITLPKTAADYYGPNESFRKHLAGNPRSWKTTYREAIGNDLNVKVNGGTLLQKYPIIIKAEKDSVSFAVKGGVGAVPVRFEGLKSVEDYQLFRNVDKRLVKLDQSVHGNDFWQTDYDAATKTYKMSFNLPLDDIPDSSWVLKK